MKKFLSMCLVALMLVSCVSVVASAAAADWVAGNGFNIVKRNAEGKGEVVENNTPVTVTDAADGVYITHGGYYQDGINWGGVASKEKYNLNGFEMVVRYDEVPTVTADDDCWMTFSFLEKPEMFQVGNIAGNRGFMPLIRFGKPYVEFREGVGGFAKLSDTQADPRTSMFAIKSGDVVTYSVDYTEDFLYVVGIKVNDLEYTNKFSQYSELFADGKAHIITACSLMGAEKDAFKYTILSVKDGVEKTAEDIAAEAAAKEEKAKLEAEEEARKEAEKQKKKEEREKQKAAEEAGEVADDKKGDDKNEATTDIVEETGSNVIVWVIVAIAAVAIIAVVVVVVLKKKKN